MTFHDHHGLRLRYQDGVEIKDWLSGPTLNACLKEMGEKGWELAAASSGNKLYGSSDNHHLYFKRPL